MAKNYTLTFKSLRAGTVYTLYIGGGTGDAVALKPAGQPLTTQEDDDADEYLPIRRQTGYLRIVDDGTCADGTTPLDWKDLIPQTDTARPVKLSHMEDETEVTDWVGFMQSQTFGGQLYNARQEREFPIQCPLSVTEGTDINHNQTAIQNFAYLLKQVIDSIPAAARPTEVMVQGGELARTMLLKMIDWQNFATEGDNDTMEARYSMYECLEDMCRFWGWTARVYRQTLYLTCADDANMFYFLQLSATDLATMAAGGSAGTLTQQTYLGGALNTGFGSMDNDDEVMRGYNRAEVQADINAADDNIINTDTDLMYRLLTKNGYQNLTEDAHGASRYTVDQLTLAHPTLTFSCTEGNATLNFAQLYDKDNSQKAEVKMIRILKSYNAVTPTVHASVALKYDHVYSKNWLELHADIYRKYAKLDTSGDAVQGTNKMYVRIGIAKNGYQTMWLQSDGTWANTNTAIQMSIGNEDDRLWFYNPNPVNEPAYVERREVADGLSGTLFIEFMGSADLPEVDGERSFDIASLRVVMYHGDIAAYAYQNHYWWKFENDENVKRTVTYKAKNQNAVDELFNADCIFASDNHTVFGFGLLSNPDRTYFKGMQYEEHAALVFPEQHLANRVADYWETSRRLLSIDLRCDVYIGVWTGDLTPRYKVTIDGTLCHIIAISRNWRDDVVRYTLLEMPNIPDPEPEE